MRTTVPRNRTMPARAAYKTKFKVAKNLISNPNHASIFAPSIPLKRISTNFECQTQKWYHNKKNLSQPSPTKSTLPSLESRHDWVVSTKSSPIGLVRVVTIAHIRRVRVVLVEGRVIIALARGIVKSRSPRSGTIASVGG